MARQQRKSTERTTIRDVATKAKVSPMTVSRVINGETGVKPDTREKVQAAIRELNYAPSAAARSLAGATPHRIGVLYNNPSLGYMSEFLLGVIEESSRTGTQLIVEKCPDPDKSGEVLQRLRAAGVEGIILPPPLSEAKPLLAELRAHELPAVAVAVGQHSPDFATIRIDNEAAARELTQHLLDLGHRRFGFITGHPNQTVSAQRLNGFLALLDESGITPDRIDVQQGYFTYRSGIDAAEKLLAKKLRPSAIFAANDDMAAGALAVAHRLGLQVPEDVSIVGFDDTQMATTVWPSLTTIRQPTSEMAASAVDTLLEEIRRVKSGGEGLPPQLLHPHCLIKRDSCALPPKARA